VSLEPAPAITGTRPAARSTVMRTTRSRSASESVTASPVEPDRHEAMDAFGDLPVDERAERRLVEFAFVGERA
jgi:hypothetical protein